MNIKTLLTLSCVGPLLGIAVPQRQTKGRLETSFGGSEVTAEQHVDAIIRNYVHTHDRLALDPSKGFIYGIYGCPRQFGNRMQEFLNDFAIAIITDRNLVWQFTRHSGDNQFSVGTEEECQTMMARKPWMPSSEHEILTNKSSVLYHFKDFEDLACYGLHNIEDDVIELDALMQFQAESLAKPGAFLNGDMQKRADRLFAAGAEHAYGQLLKAAFEFQVPTIRRPTNRVLHQAGLIDIDSRRKTENSLWVSAHLRHKNEDTTDDERTSFANVVWNQSMEFLTNRTGPCAFLLATDDEVSEDYLRPIVEGEGCTLVRAELGEVEESWKGEHGEHTGLGAMRDMNLLAWGDVLVGTSWSSFTMVIAEQILAKKPDAPFAQCGKYACSLGGVHFPRPTDTISCGSETEPVFLSAMESTKLKIDAIDRLITEHVSATVPRHTRAHGDQANVMLIRGDGCPGTLREALNAMALGVISGRPLAWGAGSGFCGGALHRNLWIPAQRNESTPVKTVSVLSKEELACSVFDDDIANVTGKPIVLKGVNQYEVSALAAEDAVLPEHMRSRAKALFALGQEHAFGKLFNSAFSFDEGQVILPVQDFLLKQGLLDEFGQRPDGSAWLGLHLSHRLGRHARESERKKLATTAWRQAKRMLPAHEPCTVLLSTDPTDNGISERTLKSEVQGLGCKFVRTPEPSSPHADFRDLYMLSRADILVGTAWSSFTQSVAELILARKPDARFARCGQDRCRFGTPSHIGGICRR